MKSLVISPSSYEKIRFLGSGWTGKVYLVHERSTKHPNVIKFIKTGDTDINTISDHILPLTRIKHTAILPILGYSLPDQNKGRPLGILAEFSSVGSLQAVLDNVLHNIEQPYWNSTTMMKTIFGIAEGCRYLHENNVVHNDLVPGNVLFFDNYEPKISDYLINTFISPVNSLPKTNLRYMAPEKQSNNKPSQPGDVFSFGMIVYSILSSQNTLYLDDDISSMILQGKRPSLDSLPECFQILISRCWAQDPSERPSFNHIVQLFVNQEISLPDQDTQQIEEYQCRTLSNSFAVHALFTVSKTLRQTEQNNKVLENRIIELNQRIENMDQKMLDLEQIIEKRFIEISDSLNKQMSEREQAYKNSIELTKSDPHLSSNDLASIDQLVEQIREEEEEEYQPHYKSLPPKMLTPGSFDHTLTRRKSVINSVRFEGVPCAHRRMSMRLCVKPIVHTTTKEEINNTKSSSNIIESFHKKIKPTPPVIKKSAFQYPFLNDPFKGIIYHLVQKYGDIIGKGMIVIEGNSTDKSRQKELPYLLDFTWQKCWTSANKPNSYVHIDFKDLQVCVSHYSIKTYACGPGYSHLKSWVLEGSNNKTTWTELSQINDDEQLNGKSKIATYECTRTGDFRHIRLRMTGPSHYGDDYLILTNIEFFGDLL